MPEPVVSVIIPSFNRAWCLPKALDSLVAQTWPHWEAVVIDDGSSDDTRAVVAQRYGQDRRVRYIYQNNGGVSSARNHGLSVATGDFVAYLDSDDIWEPWKLDLQMACFRRHPDVGMIWSDMKAVDTAGSVVSPSYLRKMYSAYEWYKTPDDLFDHSEELGTLHEAAAHLFPGRRFHRGDIFSRMMMGNLVHTSTVVMRRSVSDQVGAFREDWRFTGEDFHYHWRVCREAPAGYLDVPSILYQVGSPDQLTKPEYNVHCAEAFLLTLHEFLERDGHRISLPRRMIERSLAHAHLWLGEELVLAGERKRGRTHLAKSLQYATSGRALHRLVLASLPGELHRILKSACSRLRRAEAAACLAPVSLVPDLLEFLSSAGEMLA